MSRRNPRTRFCWVCSRQLRANYFATIEVDGVKHDVHKDCAKGHYAAKDRSK